MVNPHTPERRPRDSSVSSWPSQQQPARSPAVSSALSSPAEGGRRSPRKPARPARTPQFEVEEDPAVLARREKQIEYGKNTLAYQQYTAAVPRGQRLGYHPRTPVKRRVQSRRRWDNAVRCWRVHLHYWNDPAKLAELRGQESASDTSSVVSDPAERDFGHAADTAEREAGDAAQREAGHGADTAQGETAGGGSQTDGGDGGAMEMEEGDGGAAAGGQLEADRVPSWAEDVEGLAVEMAE